jgi:Sulfotransferase domain
MPAPDPAPSLTYRPVVRAPEAAGARYHPGVLVWVVSYPRSGNTFLRILLHRRYGLRTAVIYDVDGVAERLGPELVGFAERPASLESMRASDQLHFVKTHRQRDDDVDEGDRAICLVRDGRDALVSWARQRCEEPGRDFHTELQRMIDRDKPRGTGSWGSSVLSWLRPVAPNRVVLRYEDLVGDPSGALQRVLSELGLPSRAAAGVAVPSFAELHDIDPEFFRRGRTGTHRDELPEDLHRMFWSRPDNAAAMALLGYGVAAGSAERSDAR